MDELESFGFEPGKGKYHEEIVYRLVILHALIFDNISDFLTRYKLTPAKMNVLMIVKHQGGEKGIRQTDLSQRLMVTTSNMTRVLDKLQRDNLVMVGNTNDRRVKLIRITTKGSKLLDRVWPGYTQRLLALTKAFSDKKQQELSITLAQWMNFLITK